jgi:phytoene synthase
MKFITSLCFIMLVLVFIYICNIMVQLYNDTSFRISKIVTHSYSTSFSIAVSFLDKEMQRAIYSIYGFVRFADEIVDTFHDYNKKDLLTEFERSYYKAYKEGISLNPVLHSFQITVKKYNIPDDLIQAFLKSMYFDLVKSGSYSKPEMDEYIYGSAEAVGLMCLCIFVNGDKSRYEELKHPAMKLGAAFQKVNFLRDIKNDIYDLNRGYFPEIKISTFGKEVKDTIIRDIESDFSAAYKGIKELPKNAKLPVLIANYYYLKLLKKIKHTPAEELVKTRIRVPDFQKTLLLVKAFLKVKMRLI